MKKMLLAAVAAASFAQVAAAQTAPVIIVVDANKAGTECSACRTALAQIQQQGQGIQSLQQQLAAPLQAEGQGLQKQVDALGGKEPDAALAAKIQAFQRKQATADQQLQARAASFQNNRNYVLKQISDRIGPAIDAVQAKRRANIVLEASSVARFSPAFDATADVIAELNRTLTSVATTAPAQAQTQGR